MKRLTSIALLLALCLSLSAFAADEGFNAGIDRVDNQDGSITITVQDSTVLREQKPSLTIYCDGTDWTDVRVTFDGAVIPSEWTEVNNAATFRVARGGSYKLEAYTGADKVIHFAKADGTTETRTLTASDTALPADSQAGQEFLGWSIDGQTVTALTGDLYAALDDGQTVEGLFRAISSPGISVPMYTVSAPGVIPGGRVTASPLSTTAGARITVYAAPDAGYRLASLSASGQPLTDLGGGKYAFTMPASAVKITAAFEQIPAAPVFTDVTESDYFSAAVAWAVEQGITQGVSATAFGPNEACTRAQIVTFLWRAAGSPEPASAANPFTDLDEKEYYYKAVLWAVEQGITLGTSPTTFGPEETVDRSQAVTFLHRAAGAPAADGHSFADVPAGEYYASAVAWALEQGITLGTSDTTFSPEDDCVRAQIIAFLYRMLQ